MKLYQELAMAHMAYWNSVKSGNSEWTDRWFDKIEKIVNSLPHGSGIDGETKFNFDMSNDDKLVINSSYHCMNDAGYYDGWIDFSIIITPDWTGPNVVISGRFRAKYADVKDYLEELFYNALVEEFEEE